MVCQRLPNDYVGVEYIAVFQETAERAGFQPDDSVKRVFRGKNYSKTTPHLYSSVCRFLTANRINYANLFFLRNMTVVLFRFSWSPNDIFHSILDISYSSTRKKKKIVGVCIQYPLHCGATQKKKCRPPPS